LHLTGLRSLTVANDRVGIDVETGNSVDQCIVLNWEIDAREVSLDKIELLDVDGGNILGQHKHIEAIAMPAKIADLKKIVGTQIKPSRLTYSPSLKNCNKLSANV
jgi:hypothetical protein